MKKLYPILIFFFLSVAAFSQQDEIFQGNSNINETNVESWDSYIKDDVDLVRKSFIRFAKDKYGLKTKKGKKKNLIIEQAILPGISEKRGDLYVILDTDKKMTKVGMAFFIGYDIPISSGANPTEMENLKIFFKEFILYYKTEYFNTLIEENKKRIKELSSELRKNQQELKSLSKSIKKADKTISQESNEDVKFKLNNQNIESRAKTQAINDIVSNIKEEIKRVSASLKEINKSLDDLNKKELDN